MIQRKRELEKRVQEEFVKARKEAINHHSLARMKTLSGKEQEGMASLPYPLNRLNNYVRVGMARMPYPPTDCHSYIKINMNSYLYAAKIL